jgi:hypothetical protein
MALFDVDLSLKNLERILNQVKKADKLSCEVGIKAGARYKSGIPVSEVATYLEYGWIQAVSPKQSKWFKADGVYNIKSGTTLINPPRPTFRTAAELHGDEWLQIGSSNLNGFIDNPYNAITQALKIMGMAAVQDIQECITTGGYGDFIERSPLTMLLYANAAQKGKKRIKGQNQTTTTKPLFKTGKFAASIAFNITNR